MEKIKTFKAPYAFIIIEEGNIFHKVSTKLEAKNLILKLQGEGKKVIELYRGYILNFQVQTKTYSNLKIG